MLLRPLTVIAVLCLVPALATSQAFPRKIRKKTVTGPRVIVIDDRLAALRERPDPKAPLITRLHRGREIGLFGRSRNGYAAVTVSRSTRGWILLSAIVRPQSQAGAAALLTLIEETSDEYQKERLARLLASEFPQVAPKALLLLGSAAEDAAEKLTRDATKKFGDVDSELLMNFTGLDRHNRIGVTFDLRRGKFLYDGAAYRELIRKFPGSAEAVVAGERLGRGLADR